MEQKDQESVKLINVMIRVKNAFFILWPLVLVLTVLGGVYSAAKAKRSYVPMYESKAVFTVESTYDYDGSYGVGSYYDQYAAQQMAEAFPQILATSMMYDLVIDQVAGGYINGSASAYAVAETNMLVLTVQSTVPADAKNYLEAIIECYPQVAVYMVDNPQMKIIQQPNLPTEPYNSYSTKTAALKGALTGAVAGMLIVFVFGIMTRTIQTADELKSNINLPILVALPKISQKKRRKGVTTFINGENDPNMSECLRGLRLKVKKILDTPEKKTILLTSTLPGEGKTTVALNLAYSLVRDGHSVVILDADIRSQSVARSLGEKAVGPSLLDLMKDPELSVVDQIRTDKDGRLAFVSGRSTDKRHYTIDRAAMQRILNELTKRYDYVILDTSPCDVVSDAAALCRYADCVLYVVRQDYAKRSQVINTVTGLYQKDVKIDGCIFNGVPQFHRQYGYGYRSTYGYGYDYGYRKYGYGNKYGYGYSKYAEKKTEK